MKALELKIPPALLALLFAAGMWLIDQLLPQFKQQWMWHNTAAQLIFAVAVMLIVAGIISFRMAKTTVDPTHPEKATTVVTTGIYKFTRNPMYLGFLLGLLAFVFKLANPLTLVFLPVFVLYMNQFQIKPEERVLSKLFKAQYSEYMDTVRRWI